jgi:hypothetical protein
MGHILKNKYNWNVEVKRPLKGQDPTKMDHRIANE